MRKSLAILGAGALALVALVAAPSAAQAVVPAHCSPHFTVTPAQYRTNAQTVALGTGSRTVTFNVALTVPAGEFNDCPAVTSWDLEAGDNVNGSGDRNLYIHPKRSSPVVTIDSRRLDNTDAGNEFEVGYWYKAGGSWYSADETLTIKRATKFTGFNASPEPVVQGNQILNTGTLLRANWDTQKFSPYAGRTLKYQDRDALGGDYVVRSTHPSTILTNNAGFASATRRADISRVHRFSYYGNSTSGAVAAYGDYVVVTP